MKILIVEDKQEIRSLLEEHMSSLGHEINTCATATVKYWIPMSGEDRRYEELRVFPFLENQVLIIVRDMTNWASN